MLSESHISRQIRDFLTQHGWRIVRMQRTVVPGQFQAGEPGIPDLLALRYMPKGAGLILWLEIKRPEDRRSCRCAQNVGTRKRCSVCDQANWHKRERASGAAVWIVKNFEAFAETYQQRYGWLHSGDSAVGQLDLLA